MSWPLPWEVPSGSPRQTSTCWAAEHDEILGAVAAALKLLGQALLPANGNSALQALAQSRTETRELVNLLAFIACRAGVTSSMDEVDKQVRADESMGESSRHSESMVKADESIDEVAKQGEDMEGCAELNTNEKSPGVVAPGIEEDFGELAVIPL